VPSGEYVARRLRDSQAAGAGSVITAVIALLAVTDRGEQPAALLGSRILDAAADELFPSF
jgi:hypothetical protein